MAKTFIVLANVDGLGHERENCQAYVKVAKLGAVGRGWCQLGANEGGRAGTHLAQHSPMKTSVCVTNRLRRKKPMLAKAWFVALQMYGVGGRREL